MATLTAAGLSFGLVACGGGSATDAAAQAETTAQAQTPADASASTGSTGATGSAGQASQGMPPGGPGGGMELTAKQEKCLAEQGVETPSGGDSGDGSQSTPPDQGSMPDQDAMSAAFAACGIDLPEPPGGSGDTTQPSGQGPTSGAPVRGSDD
ncbi:MAG: hypothetical protein J0H66_14680 [Solirubrobacterales bacterium]|nr:hypothetical protein [Solirubrobacterales bacterium]